MKANQLKLLLAIAILIISCGNNQSSSEFERIEIWENIRVAAKEKRIDYLLNISKDTLDCIECNDGKNWITKEDFFNNYLGQIEISDKKKYSIYSEEYERGSFTKRYRINYTYGGNVNEKAYNLIYTILVGEKEIQFQGVFGVP